MPPAAVWVNALIIGSTIVMMASGLVLVFGIMGILNWTHGQLYMLGAFVVYYAFVGFGVNYFASLLVAAVLVALVGVVIERCLLRPLSGKGFLPASVVSLGLIFVLEGAATVFFGVELKSVPSVFKGVVRVGSASVSAERLVLVGMAITIMLGLYVFINRTRMGLAIRAAAQEPVVAGLYGVKAGRLYSVTMAIGCALAALAGGLMAPAYFVGPQIGAKPLIVALLAIVLGGLGSFRGAIAGGMILGFVTSLGGYYMGPWHELISFLAVILIILIRPQGLFGMSDSRV